jgi:hypothetical protein
MGLPPTGGRYIHVLPVLFVMGLPPTGGRYIHVLPVLSRKRFCAMRATQSPTRARTCTNRLHSQQNCALQQEFSQNSLSFKSDVEPTDVDRELDTRDAMPQQVHQVHADDIYKHHGSSLVVNQSASHEKNAARESHLRSNQASLTGASCTTRLPAPGRTWCACLRSRSSLALKSCISHSGIVGISFASLALPCIITQAEGAARQAGGAAQGQTVLEPSGGRLQWFSGSGGGFRHLAHAPEALPVV